MSKTMKGGLVKGAVSSLLLFVSATSIAFGGIITIDVWQSFPDSQGDNGFFAYRYNPITDNYTLLNDAGSFFFNTPPTQWDAPSMAKYSSPYIAMWASGTYSYIGNPEDSVLAYVAPEDASYRATGSWLVNGSSGNGMDAYIKYNNTILWSSYLGPGAMLAFDVTSLLNTGDSIYFGVNAHNTNSFSELNDGAYLIGAQIAYETAPVSAVPEPGTVGLLSLGLAGLICFGRKRRYY